MTVTDYGLKMEEMGIKRSQNYQEITSMLQWLWSKAIELNFVSTSKTKMKYLEIGSYAGESLLYFAAFLPKGSEITVVDLGDNSQAHAKLLEVFNFIESTYSHTINFIGGDSTGVRVVDAARALGPYDIVLIDANHTFENASKDIQNYGPMAKVVVLHDVNEAAIQRAKDKHKIEQAITAHIWKAWKMIGKEVKEFIDPMDYKGLGVYVN